MKTYDDVISFDYTNTEEWRNFVKSQILPLHKSISKIVKLRENIEESLSNNLSDLIRNNTNIKQILIGGVDENGDYKPDSLARVYKEFLGVSINTREWVFLCKQPGIDTAESIKCNFADTPFLQLVKDIKEIIEKLFLLIEIDSQEISKNEVKDDEIKEILENPEKIVGELKTIYDSLVSISANHSYHTFFIINTRCIPRYYIEQAYPKLKDRFEEVSEFLGLEPKFVPVVKEGEIKRNPTLWGHKEDGFAALIYKLNGIIWGHFEKEEFRKIFEFVAIVRNLKQEYCEKMNRKLSEIDWSFPNYISPNMNGGGGSPYWYREYEIDGIWLSKCYEEPSWSRYSEREVEFDGKSLIELFNDISPALLLGKIYYEEKISYAYDDAKYLEHYTLTIMGNRLRIRVNGPGIWGYNG